MNENTYDALFYKSLGEVLVKARQSRGRTFEDIAYILDVPPMTFYKWENGSRKIPLDKFKKLCIIYHLNTSDVLDEVNEKVKMLL